VDAHQVIIKGFASFLLESVGGEGQNSTIIGSFVKTIAPGSVGAEEYSGLNDYGVYASYLAQ
jgi:hypothetical protein